jgi:diguanylate cyclase (GGDEF)-like protein/PAS domain S-box-containing protein
MHPTIPAGPAPGNGPENDLRAEQLSLLTRNRADQYATIFTAAITVAVVQHLYPAWLLALWYALSCGVLFLRAYIGHRYHARDLNPQSLRNWARLITGSIVAAGLLWGLTGTAILLASDLKTEFFIIMMGGGALAVGATVNAAYRPAMLGFGLGIQVPIIAALLTRHDAMHVTAGALLIVYTAMIINAAMKFNRIITDNIRMRFAQEKLLAQAQSSQSAMAEAQRLAKTGSWVRDLATNIVTLSPEAYRIFGIDPANLTPDFSEIEKRVHPADRAIVEARAAASRLGLNDVGLDHRIIMDDGTVKYLHVSPRSILDAAGRTTHVTGSIQDVTARRAAEDRLQFANILLNTQMEASRDGILVADRGGRIIGVNRRYGELSRTRVDDLLGQDFQISVDRVRLLLKDLAALRRRAEAIEANPLDASEAEFELTDGRVISRYMTPLRTANGDNLGRAFFYTDITERKHAAAALAYRDRLLHTVTAATAVAVGALSLADGVQAALSKIGESMDVDRILVFRDAPDQLPPLALVFAWESPAVQTSFKLKQSDHQFDPREMAAWRAPLADGKPVIAQRETATGAVRAMMEHHGTQSCLLMPVFFGGALWGFLGIDACAAARDWAASEIETIGILADITGSLIVRERSRIALETSEKRFRLLTNTARDAVTLTDDAALILQWNHAAEQMFGYSEGEALGKDIVALLGPRGKKAEIARILGAVSETNSITMELSVCRKDGGEMAAEISVSAARVGERLEFITIMRDITERTTAAQKLQFANILLGTQMEASPDGILVLGANGKMVSCNQRYAEMWRVPAALLEPGNDDARREHIMTQVTSPEAYIARIGYLMDHKDEIGEDELLTTDGRILERYSQSMTSPTGGHLGYVWFFGDVTARKAAEQKLLLANSLLKTQMEAAPDGIYVVDSGSQIMSYNQRFMDMWGIDPAVLRDGGTKGVQAHTAAMVKNPEDYKARIAYLNQHPGETADDALELNDGRIFERHSVSIQAAGQDNLGRVWFCRDVTARRAADALALRLARYDALTGLANRAVFVEAIHQAIAHARRDGTGFAVLFLDLDHFKDVNDTLGHPAGDALLKGVAARLLGATRETDTVGRFGGDEFAVILSGIQDAGHAGTLAEKLITAINIPLVIELNTVHVRASIGIELFSPTAEDSDTLLAHADVALYRAKAEGRGTFRFFTAAMDRDVRGRVTLGTELREALGTGEFLLLYQPQVEASTGAITGVEALIRWRHPTRGLLAPETFIEAAETTGAITQLGHFVLWTACRQAASWALAGHAPPRISFNVSALQFKSSRTLEADIMAALAQTGLPPAMLELELTESALMSTSQETNNVLRRLKEHGVKLAIDDFGTGYSSLEYLRRFPADHIKIARAFTKNVETEASDAAIVRAIIGLAAELNITTIAEGIETSAQLNLIASWGCTQVQGFFASRPLTTEKITALLKAGTPLLDAAKSQIPPCPGLTRSATPSLLSDH